MKKSFATKNAEPILSAEEPVAVYTALTTAYLNLIEHKIKLKKDKFQREADEAAQEKTRKLEEEDRARSAAEKAALEALRAEEARLLQYKIGCLRTFADEVEEEKERAEILQILEDKNTENIKAKYRAVFEGVASVVLITRDDKDAAAPVTMLEYKKSNTIATAIFESTHLDYTVGCAMYTTGDAAHNAEELSAYLHAHANEYPQALFFYGQSGSGKSTQCNDVLKFYINLLLRDKRKLTISVSQVYGLIDSDPDKAITFHLDMLTQFPNNFGDAGVSGVEKTAEGQDRDKSYILSQAYENHPYDEKFVLGNGLIDGKVNPTEVPISTTDPFNVDGHRLTNLNVEAWAQFLDYIQVRKLLRFTENNPESSRSIVFYRLFLDGIEQVVLVDLPGNENKIGVGESVRNQESAFIAFLLPIMQAIFVHKKGNGAFLPAEKPPPPITVTNAVFSGKALKGLSSGLAPKVGPPQEPKPATKISFRRFLVPAGATDYRRQLFTREWAIDEMNKWVAKLSQLRAVKFEKGIEYDFKFNTTLDVKNPRECVIKLDPDKKQDEFDNVITYLKKMILEYSSGNTRPSTLKRQIGFGKFAITTECIANVENFFKDTGFLAIQSCGIDPILTNLAVLKNPASKLHLILTGWRSCNKTQAECAARFDALCQTLQFASDLHAKLPAECAVNPPPPTGGTRVRHRSRANKTRKQR